MHARAHTHFQADIDNMRTQLKHKQEAEDKLKVEGGENQKTEWLLKSLAARLNDRFAWQDGSCMRVHVFRV